MLSERIQRNMSAHCMTPHECKILGDDNKNTGQKHIGQYLEVGIAGIVGNKSKDTEENLLGC